MLNLPLIPRNVINAWMDLPTMPWVFSEIRHLYVRPTPPSVTGDRGKSTEDAKYSGQQFYARKEKVQITCLGGSWQVGCGGCGTCLADLAQPSLVTQAQWAHHMSLRILKTTHTWNSVGVVLVCLRVLFLPLISIAWILCMKREDWKPRLGPTQWPSLSSQ